MIDRLRKISYFLAYAVVTIPLWHYIRDGYILVFMVAVMLFAYIMVVLSSVQASQTILSSEKSKIAFPRWLPDKPKYQKWWSLFRHTLKWHLLLVIPKMGLALEFVQYFYITRPHSYHMLLRNYGYYSQDVLSNLPMPPISLITTLLGLLFIVSFTIVETQLISSLSLKKWAKFHKASLKILAMRALLSFSITAIYFLIINPTGSIFYKFIPSSHIICHYGFADYMPHQNRTDSYSRCDDQFEETIQTSLNTMVYQSVLLASNIMRPIRDDTLYGSYCWDDNRPFVARQVLSGLLGLLLYAGTTWVILWFVEDEPEHTLN